MTKLSLLAVFAHPDDEAFGTAGTLAKYAREGVLVSLISATRGEAGEVAEPGAATPLDLAAVREAELRAACDIVGVANLRFLECPDGAVAACSRNVTIGKLVAAMREWRPQVVITFGTEGIYGHPDHVAVHNLTVAACAIAAKANAYPEQVADGLVPHKPLKVYFVVLPRTLMPDLAGEFLRIRRSLSLPARGIASFFAPDDRVTTVIDIGQYAQIKHLAIAAHRTQVGDTAAGAVSGGGPEFNAEYYHRRGMRRKPGSPYETDLFAGLR